MNYIESLQQRYSVKKFDAEQKIPAETVQNILEAGKLAASSLGLQPYRIIVAESKDSLQKLIPAFYNPSQVATCSHLIAIVTRKNIDEKYINNYFSHISETREIPVENLQGFKKSIDFYLNLNDETEILHWNEKQGYLVLGNLMFAAALEKVDSCPMEGFRPDEISEILGIDSETEKVTVTLALGYRAADDSFQKMKKVRKPNDKLFKFI